MLQSETVRKYDTYKDSGIEWIGKIPSDKNLLRNKYFLKYIKGKNPEQLNSECKGVPYVGASELDNLTGTPEYENYTEQLELPQCTNSNVLVLWDGARAGLIGKNHCGAISSTIIKLEPNLDKINENYLFYYLKGFEKFLYDRVNGTTIPHMNRDYIEEIKWIDFTIDEQQKIAEYLDKKCGEIDRVIETEKLVIEKLKEYKQSIITEAVTKGLDKNTQFKDSSIEYIGNIPSNWNIKRLRYFATCQNGISKGGEFFGDGSPFVSYGDVYNNNVLPEVVEGLCMVTDTEKENYSVREGDIFFTRTSETIEEIAITCVCKKTIENATFAGFLIRVRPYTDELVVGYSKYYFASEIHRKFFVKEMNLVTRASLSQELLKKLPVLIPPKDEQQRIAEYLDKKCSIIDKAIADKEQVIEKFTEYKKSLIYECVTGKKRVA